MRTRVPDLRIRAHRGWPAPRRVALSPHIDTGQARGSSSHENGVVLVMDSASKRKVMVETTSRFR